MRVFRRRKGGRHGDVHQLPSRQQAVKRHLGRVDRAATAKADGGIGVEPFQFLRECVDRAARDVLHHSGKHARAPRTQRASDLL